MSSTNERVKRFTKPKEVSENTVEEFLDEIEVEEEVTI